MISLDKAVIARLKREDLVLEIYVDPEKARQFRSGENIKIDDLIASRDIYTDRSQGEKPTDQQLIKAFGTAKFDDVVKKILEKGEIQLTTEQRKKMQEDRLKQIITLIAREAVDPRTHTPHPVIRIEKALTEAKFHVDPFKNAEAQMEEALKALRPIIPIKMEKVRIAIRVAANHSGPVCGFMKSYKIIREEWSGEGAYMCVVEISAGMQGELLDKINKMTHGEVDAKITETI